LQGLREENKVRIVPSALLVARTQFATVNAQVWKEVNELDIELRSNLAVPCA